MNYACIGALENSWTRASECHNSGYHVKSGGGGYGATAARLTPDQKVGSSNLSALICRVWGDPFSSNFLELEALAWQRNAHW